MEKGKTGILYGIGVGPGDPELMTIRAVKRLKNCQVVAMPGSSRDSCVAYQIAVQAVPEIRKKEWLCLSMPMTRDPGALEENRQEAARAVARYLDQGKDVGFITLGDVAIYSTGAYLLSQVAKTGYLTRLESGIPSFCAAAARLNLPLAKGLEELHIIPASCQVEEALKLPGVKVLMKAGRQMPKVKEALGRLDCQVAMVENCGMEGERVYQELGQIPDAPSYYSLLIVR